MSLSNQTCVSVPLLDEKENAYRKLRMEFQDSFPFRQSIWSCIYKRVVSVHSESWEGYRCHKLAWLFSRSTFAMMACIWIVLINLLKTQNEPSRISSPVGKDNQDIPILHQRQFEGNTILHGMSSFGLHSVMGKCPWFAGSQQIGVFSTNGSSSWSVRFQQGTARSIPIRSGREILYLSLPPEILEVGLLLLLLLLVGSNWCAFRRSSSWRWQFPALIS